MKKYAIVAILTMVCPLLYSMDANSLSANLQKYSSDLAGSLNKKDAKIDLQDRAITNWNGAFAAAKNFAMQNSQDSALTNALNSIDRSQGIVDRAIARMRTNSVQDLKTQKDTFITSKGYITTAINQLNGIRFASPKPNQLDAKKVALSMGYGLQKIAAAAAEGCDSKMTGGASGQAQGPVLPRGGISNDSLPSSTFVMITDEMKQFLYNELSGRARLFMMNLEMKNQSEVESMLKSILSAFKNKYQANLKLYTPVGIGAEVYQIVVDTLTQQLALTSPESKNFIMSAASRAGHEVFR